MLWEGLGKGSGMLGGGAKKGEWHGGEEQEGVACSM